MAKFYGWFIGAIIGALLGFFADQLLTSYVLLHAEEAATIIITNALSAFLMFPLFVIGFSLMGYRHAKKSANKPA